MDPTEYGDPKFIQKLKLWLAQHRPAPLRALRCWRGKHNPPADKVFTCMGAVIVGGPCSRCGDEVAREVCWIGNVWDFQGAATKEKSDGGTTITVSPRALLPQLQSLGLAYIGDYPA
jgi:hypothetical protein